MLSPWIDPPLDLSMESGVAGRGLRSPWEKSCYFQNKDAPPQDNLSSEGSPVLYRDYTQTPEKSVLLQRLLRDMGQAGTADLRDWAAQGYIFMGRTPRSGLVHVSLSEGQSDILCLRSTCRSGNCRSQWQSWAAITILIAPHSCSMGSP